MEENSKKEKNLKYKDSYTKEEYIKLDKERIRLWNENAGLSVELENAHTEIDELDQEITSKTAGMWLSFLAFIISTVLLIIFGNFARG